MLRKTIVGLLGLTLTLGLSAAPGAAVAAPDLQLTVDGRDTGRVFNGIGAVTNGAYSSRLLHDYPEAQRSQILDYLFKPGYGASLQHLKHDMGSDSYNGAATKHEPDDESFNRGHGWWLMREAKRRNPNIKLSLLQSSAPGWVGGYFTQANLDLVVGYVEGAKRHHGLTFDYIAAPVNEPTIIRQEVDWNWVKRLDSTLHRRGNDVKLIVGDDQVRTCCPTPLPWKAAEAMRADPELKAAVDVVGSHYAGGTTPDYVKDFGIPVWSSEDGPWLDGWNDWLGGSHTATGSMYNLNYIDGRMTSTLYWTLVSAFYDNQLFPNNGLMRASEPWSGHYQVTSPLWITAHTTQFAQPGWRYLDQASRVLPKGGSVVTLKSPDNRNYSAVFETQRTRANEIPTERQTVSVRVDGGLTSTGSVHVWKSTMADWFIQQPDIPVVNGTYEITLEPDAVYSVTTTTGQRKGEAAPPAAAPFPRSYRDDFEQGAREQQPKYLAAQGGSYELGPCAGGRRGQCVEQAVRHQPLEWARGYPTAFLGDSTGWSDVSVETSVLHRQPGPAEVWARVGNRGAGLDLELPILPEGYYLSVEQTGRWELGYVVKGERTRLTAGHTPLPAGAWHTIGISARGTTITATIGGKPVGHANDGRYTRGRAGIGTLWNRVQFDDFTVTPG